MHLEMLTNHLLNINLTKALMWKPFSIELNVDLLVSTVCEDQSGGGAATLIFLQPHKHKHLQGSDAQL